MHMMKKIYWRPMARLISLFLFLILSLPIWALPPKVELGVEVFFADGTINELKGKRVALVTNHTGVDSKLRSTIDRLKQEAPGVKLVALFAPEHGINGHAYAFESVDEKQG